jgi:hypothetical protein
MKLNLLAGVLLGSMALAGTAFAGGGGTGSGVLGSILGNNPAPGTQVDNCAVSSLVNNPNGTARVTSRNVCTYTVRLVLNSGACSQTQSRVSAGASVTFDLGTVAQCGTSSWSVSAFVAP